MINKIAAIIHPRAARMQNGETKSKEECWSIPSCVQYTITPIRIKTPVIKQCTAPLYSLPFYFTRRVILHNVIDHRFEKYLDVLNDKNRFTFCRV